MLPAIPGNRAGIDGQVSFPRRALALFKEVVPPDVEGLLPEGVVPPWCRFPVVSFRYSFPAFFLSEGAGASAAFMENPRSLPRPGIFNNYLGASLCSHILPQPCQDEQPGKAGYQDRDQEPGIGKRD